MARRSTESVAGGKGNPTSIVDELLALAQRRQASDVHFEPTGSGLLVKFRVDGVLENIESLPQSVSDNIITRLKVLGGLLTYRNDVPQEGRLQVKDENNHVVDQRLAVFPTIHGQRAVVRLFYAQRELMHLDQLGFAPAVLTELQAIACENQGLLLLTGPAGSGKSTTLGAMLRHILAAFPGKSIVALEDPVEQQIPGVTQVQIPPQGEMTFPVALRSLLRQDPQVLMIGEIRDAQTARVAIEAALTGHLLLSTMHSGSPAGALLRLIEMGIEPYQVTSSVLAVLNQRLVRKLCEHCSRKPRRGCDKCFGTGFHGRALLSEFVGMDGPLRTALLAKADLDELETVLHRGGHVDLRQDGLRLVREGITTAEELRHACGRQE